VFPSEWAYRTVHPQAEPNRTVHFRAESPPRSKFSSASRTESGVSMLALDNVRFENIRAEPIRLLECSVWYGSARGCMVKSDVIFMLVKPSECQYYICICYGVFIGGCIRKLYYKNNRRTKEAGEQRQQCGWGFNIAVAHHSDIFIGPESAALFFHAIVLFAIVLKLKYIRTLTFLIVNITLTSELISFIL
jgi:hypothetical protein